MPRNITLTLLLLSSVTTGAELPAPMLDVVYPAGATAGQTTLIEVNGRSLAGLSKLQSSIPGFRAIVKDATHCEVTIPPDTLPGSYELWAVCDNGVTSPRTFVISRLPEFTEADANDSADSASVITVNGVINGRIEQPGDQDHFMFEATQGQRIILDCQAERIDSRLRAVLELFDSQGRRVAAFKGRTGTDPYLDVRIPADGRYIVKIHDLVFSGGAEHYYRLEVDATPRAAFAVPGIIPRGKASRIRIGGWNLPVNPSTTPTETARTTPELQTANIAGFDFVDIEIPAEPANVSQVPFRRGPWQAGLHGFPFSIPGSNTSIWVGVCDGPVIQEHSEPHRRQSPQRITVPCDVSGQLISGDEQDWYSFPAQRGEVLYFDVFSQRFGAPTDVHLSVWDTSGEVLLGEWNDETANAGGHDFRTSHLDPVGRWVAPAEGEFLLLVRNLNSGSFFDPRRGYHLSIRREEPDFQVIAMPRSSQPVGLNVRRGGRLAFDVVALRRHAMSDTIHVAAGNLPPGFECPPIALGPDVERGTMVISAESSVEHRLFSLQLTGTAKTLGSRPVSGGTVVRAGTPAGWSRLVTELPVAVAGEAPCRLTATIQDELDHALYGHLKLRYSPGNLVDVNVTLEHRDANFRPVARLIGIGLPPEISQQSATIAAGSQAGTISFWLPRTLAPGDYSLAISAETSLPAVNGKAETITVVSNPVTFTVTPSAFEVELDPFTPTRIKRGETFQVNYTARRRNGFIGKIHTELAGPGAVTNVPGLLGRGVTFVGQTEQGTIQVVVNDNAPLGSQPFLRLFGVGVIEDQPTHYGSVLFPLEITE